MTLLSSGFFALAAFALVIYSSTGLHLDAVAGEGMEGEKTLVPGQVILNEFTSVTADVKAGSTQINVSDNSLNAHARFAKNLEAGELVMIIQMQNGSKPYVDLNEEKGNVDEAGKYEFAEVAGIEEGPKINFTAALKNSYAESGKTQVVRVPRFQSLTIPKGATVTTDAWDGNTGGIVSVEVRSKILLDGSIDATGKGFNSKAFQKLLKTAAAARKQIIAADSSGSRIYFGAASINKTIKTQSSGGGIVFIFSSGTIEGNGIIKADGSSVLMPDGEIQANAGQGGSVYVCSGHSAGTITVTANGGNALQHFDSLSTANTRGQGGEGGIIRTLDANGFNCIAEGGLHASIIKNVEGIETRDSARASSGIVSVSSLSPYSQNPSSQTRLEYFAATSLNGSVNVSWVTLSEVNVDYFTVERSVDGSEFVPVYKINGKGTAGGKSSYHFEDAAQAAVDCQYRLSQTTHNNHTETFPAVRLKQLEKASETRVISVQPNPVGDHFTIKCIVSEPGIIDITLTDISGNVVRKETAVASEGMNIITVNNLTVIPKGTYFLSMTAGVQKLPTVKILK